MLEFQWMTEEHRAFAASVRRFLAEEYEPNRAAWTKAGQIPHAFWEKAGALGILGATIPEEFGGSGLPLSFDLVTFLEQARIGDMGWGTFVHSIVVHYVNAYGTREQKAGWLPKLASGEWVGAIAMTEPGTGSDLKAVRTTAKPDGNGYIINGSKTFITNGLTADFILVVAKTDPAAGTRGISLIGVETAEAAGFRRGRNLDKIGMKRQDTSELFFDEVRVPRTNLLGTEEGQGFYQLMKQLVWERLLISYCAIGNAQCALDDTLAYVRERKAFGQRIMDFQNTRFRLAEAKTEIEIFAAFLDRLTVELEEGRLTAERAAMAKYWGTEMLGRIADNCLQLHGGYGYMNEYRIAEIYADARVQRIFAGTNEIMREVIARSLDIE
ncbi:acyl-CoA dehydrogenase [Azospirillum sp. RWY-5-1]|uniref:Acyl-CoA dehydrogenase n=1 Tax=Azospirillum oleiclasticum TaxID=2735135 RepID=A0ABX2TCM9_9PROT|nr:acyl-CoA dehydrogenase family protein [Azospirillum oleiclasticum]NYZ15795.1 acyl-CoA dehydrogenase [Azospirillum oleiclasticum]NYZ22065.1 acyl-CoA dehydrogenase [Azospirillum oleiclasticum]